MEPESVFKVLLWNERSNVCTDFFTFIAEPVLRDSPPTFKFYNSLMLL